jgi:hypothetical protein
MARTVVEKRAKWATVAKDEDIDLVCAIIASAGSRLTKIDWIGM